MVNGKLSRLGLAGSFKSDQIGELAETLGLSAGAWQMRPLSRGYVEAKSNRPDDAPGSTRATCRSNRPARDHRRFAAGAALKQFVREETVLGAQIQTDDELLDYARRYGGICYHASCMIAKKGAAMIKGAARQRPAA